MQFLVGAEEYRTVRLFLNVLVYFRIGSLWKVLESKLQIGEILELI